MNIVKRGGDLIIEYIDAATSSVIKKRNVSKSSFRIALESNASMVGIYTFNERLHLVPVDNVSVGGVQLTVSNYDSLTDGLIESAGGGSGTGGGSGAISVPSNYFFIDDAARDAYFAANAAELVEGVSVVVAGVLQKYISGVWTDMTAVIKGDDGKSAYELWLEAGNSGTVTDFLNSIEGKSAYQTWLDAGNTGTEQDFLDSLKGTDGVDNSADIADIRSDISELEGRVTGIENLGNFAGSYDTFALLPTVLSAFSSLTVNDFVTVRADETHGGDTTRYVASAINSGVITWTYDVTYSTDITGKVDDVPAGTVKPQSRTSGGWVDTEITAIEFTEAGSRTNVTSGDTLKTLFGKIRKWFADLGTMAFETASDYRNADEQDDIDATHLTKDDIKAGTNVTLSKPSGTNEITINVPGVPIPDKFSSTENGTGAVGASNTYDATLLTKISGAGTLDADDVVIFANGYQGQVVSVSGSTFTAITIQQPQQATWGTIGGTLGNQADLVSEFDKKVDKVTGKGLSEADYTSAEKTKLGGIEAGAQKNVQSSWTQNDTGADNYIDGKPTGLSQFNNDSGFITSSALPDLSPYYIKPSTGIPSSDLAAVVQVLLALASSALQAADLSGHNTSGTSHNDLRILIDTVKAIAEGKSRGRSFNTKAALDAWLTVPANLTDLQVGDNFYIEETDVPDYWWTGTGILPLEVDKVFLLDYYTKTQSDNRYLQAITKALVEGVLTGDISTHTHSGYALASSLSAYALASSLASYSLTSHSHAILDYLAATATVTTLASLPVGTASKIYANLSGNTSLSCSGTPPSNQASHVFARNTSGSAITQTIPTTGSYICKDASVTIPGGGFWEFSVHWDTVVSRYRIITLGLS